MQPSTLRREQRRLLSTLKYCECCLRWPTLPYFKGHSHPNQLTRGLEMHEIIGRGAAPREKQDPLWMPGNSLWLCHGCHQASPWAVHKVGPYAWAYDLLFQARSTEQIRNFVLQYYQGMRHTEPGILFIEEQLRKRGVKL